VGGVGRFLVPVFKKTAFAFDIKGKEGFTKIKDEQKLRDYRRRCC